MKKARLERNLSQAELAAEADVEQTAISRIEVRPGYEPGAFMLYRICRCLGISMDEALGEVVEFTPRPKPTGVETVQQLQRMVGELGRNQSELATVLQEVRGEVAELRKSRAAAPRKRPQSGRKKS